LRGFRIELGEIEHVLMAHPGVRRAVVIVREDAPGVRYLVAYVVPEDAAPGETGPGETGPSAVDWREYLRQALPPHMVPQAVVCLDEIPLNPHGKLDRRSLPAPARDARPRTMPASEQEKLLAEIWGELLHQAEVSLEDSFFTLGGDSLLTIELVARLGRRGWRCTPAQVFQHQTLAELASALVRSGGDAREQVLIQGDVPLLPIQHWFFALGLDRPSYFNQSLLLEAPAGLRRECLNRAVAAILTHHDVLRTRCAAEGDGWRQWIAGDEGATPFQSFDLSQESESGQQEQIERMCGQVQGSLDLESGPLLRVVHFDLGNRRPARLLLCLHHLIVDPYSWRILLEDLLSAYQQAAAAQRILLPPKTTSCQSWSRRLVGLARDAQRLASLRQWAQGLTAAASAGLRVDVHDGDNTAASAEVLSITLSAAETARFLESAARQIDQSLCYLASALAVAHQRWAGAPLLVDVERHGRDPVVPEVDLSRTVGWLVAMFPVLLDHRAEAPVAGTLEQIARQISAVPLGGLGYGLLRYVAEDPTCRAALEAIGRADVRLNYLGRLDRVSRGQTEVRIAALRFGNEQAADSPRPHLLEIDARISGDQLLVEWTYSRNRHSRESIAELAHHFVSVLRELLQ
jgi:non-ribosomal peptide synthase protein (TIGR01720 family)